MDVFSALSDPTRRAIVELLAARGPLPATAIYDQFPFSRPAISQHLKILRESNLVLTEKKAQQRIYRLNPESVAGVESWAHQLAERWNRRFTALEQVLEEEKRKNLSRYGKDE